jgi:hypothetical protein
VEVRKGGTRLLGERFTGACLSGAVVAAIVACSVEDAVDGPGKRAFFCTTPSRPSATATVLIAAPPPDSCVARGGTRRELPPADSAPHVKRLSMHAN